MPTFEHVADGQVTERRHLPYNSRDLSKLVASKAWRKVAEGYAPAAGAAPRPSVEEQRAAANAATAKPKRTAPDAGDG